MSRLPVEVDEDQEFVESLMFSAAAADEFKEIVAARLESAGDMIDSAWAMRLLREYDRSYTDIVTVCLRRGEQIRRRLQAHGPQAINDSNLLVPWVLSLQVAVHALSHVEDRLDDWEARVLAAGRELLDGLPAAELREEFHVPWACQVCDYLH